MKLTRELGKHKGEAQTQQKEETRFTIKVPKTENHKTGIVTAIIYKHAKICK